MKFYIIDAFTENLFGGNPAGVVILPADSEFPDESIMLKTAAELRYSETAFIMPLTGSDASFHIRYFTPTDEVDLCGHATIASFKALQDSGLVTEGEEYRVRTMAGEIKATVNNDGILMSMAEPKHIGTITDLAELDRLYEIMGSEYDGSIGLLPMIISTGLPDIMLPVADLQELNALKPNMEMLADLSKKYDVTGVHAFTVDSIKGGHSAKNNIDVNSNANVDADAGGNSVSDASDTMSQVITHARNFAPLYGIDEEAATGTSNGALTYYLKINGLISEPGTCKVIQGEAMDRPSTIMTSLNQGIYVGGNACILALGEIYI